MSAVTTLTLPIRDPRTLIALNEGRLDRRLVARQVFGEEVLFEILDTEPRRPPGIGPWLQAVRAYSLTATVTPCLAVGLLLWADRASFHPLLAACALLGVALLQVAINVFNDIEDYRRLIDLPGTAGGSGVIQSGWWTPKQLRHLAWSALLAGGLLGLAPVIHSPEILGPIAVLAALGVLTYSAKKLGLKYHAMGELAVLPLCGPVLTLGYAAASATSLEASTRVGVLWLGGFCGLLATALLHVNNLQDMELDRSRGVSTLALKLGFTPSKIWLWALQLGAAACIAAGVVQGSLPRLALLGVAAQLSVALPWLIRKIQPALGPESALLSGCRIQAAQIHLLGGLACCAGLLLSRWF